MIDAFYFGNQDELFGLYHPPLSGMDREHGVLICNPFGQEFIRIHRSFLQLAQKLSGNGYHVLRYDHFASGDSLGGSDEGSVARWIADIPVAIEELCDNADAEDYSVVGARLGGSLAAIQCAQQGGCKKLVLWEPVVKGTTFSEEILESHDAWVSDQMDRPGRSELVAPEVLGFPYPKRLADEIAGIDLLAGDKKPAEQVFILSSEEVNEYESLAQHFEDLGAKTTVITTPAPKVWLKEERLENALVPYESIRQLVAWFDDEEKE